MGRNAATMRPLCGQSEAAMSGNEATMDRGWCGDVSPLRERADVEEPAVRAFGVADAVDKVGGVASKPSGATPYRRA